MYYRVNKPLFIGVLLFLLVDISCFAEELDRRVIVVDNLQSVANLAEQQRLPVLMFFAAEDCEFCEALEADYLGAMSLAKEYSKKVIIRKVMIDSYDDIYDFKGNKLNSEDFAARFNVKVTPTLSFVNYQGDTLAKKIIGYNRSGFFGAYLDQAIDEANQKVRTEKVSALRRY